MKNYKQTQIFTPPKVTNQMLDLLDQSNFTDPRTYFFEPCCGDGSMLLEIVKRVYDKNLEKYNNKSIALAEALCKFYAIEIDPELVVKARFKIWEWAVNTLDNVSEFEQNIISQVLQDKIQNKDFFEYAKEYGNLRKEVEAYENKKKQKRYRGQKK